MSGLRPLLAGLAALLATGAHAQPGDVQVLALDAPLRFTGAEAEPVVLGLDRALAFSGADAEPVVLGLDRALAFTGIEIEPAVLALDRALAFTGVESEPVVLGLDRALAFTGVEPDPVILALDRALAFTGTETGPVVLALDEALAFTGLETEPVILALDGALTFSGLEPDPVVLALDAALAFTGLETEPVVLALDAVLAFSGLNPRDLSILAEYRAEIAARDQAFEQWYTASYMAEALVENPLAPDAARDGGFAGWLSDNIGGVFWDYSSESDLRGYYWDHFTALERAEEDLENEPSDAEFAAAMDYLARGMEAWRAQRDLSDAAYFDCYLPGMLEVRRLYGAYDDIPWNDEQSDAAYGVYRARRAEAYECVSKEALNAITAEPAFVWPLDGSGD